MMIDYITAHCAKYGYSEEYTRFWIGHSRCEICGLHSDAPHHIRTRGAGGDDDSTNLLALCTTHHNEIHQYGEQKFARLYPRMTARLEAAHERDRVAV
jgi:hypothetical protein